MSAELIPTLNTEGLVPLKTRNMHGGKQMVFKFDNGYGASVIEHSFSYGIELAVIKFDDKGDDWKLCYDTEITDDVIGHLQIQSLIKTLNRIKNLEV